MDLPAFEDLLDRHGGTLEAWAAAERLAAATLLADSAAARAALAALREVEAVLGRPARAAMPTADTIAARAMRHRQEGRALRVARRAGWATAAVLLLTLGLALGHMRAAEHEDSPDHVMALALDVSGISDVD